MRNKLMLILMAGLIILSCTSSTNVVDDEGNSSEVVIGQIVDTLGVPVEDAVVSLYPSDYNPVTDSGTGKLVDSTDENGMYEFEIEEPGTYNIVCEDIGSGEGKRGGIAGYSSVEDIDTTYDTLEILPMVAKTAVIPDSLIDTTGGYVFIPGTDYSVPVSDANNKDGYYSFTFEAVPQSEGTTVYYSSTNTEDINVDSVIVDTVEDGILDTSASWDFETPVVAAGVNNFYDAEFQGWSLEPADGKINIIHVPGYGEQSPQVASSGDQYAEVEGDATFSRLYSVTDSSSLKVEIDFAPWFMNTETTRIQIFESDGTTLVAQSPEITTNYQDITDSFDRDQVWQTATVNAAVEPGDYYIKFFLGNDQAVDNIKVSVLSSY